MYKPPEATGHHKLLKLSILLPVRANSLCTLQCETPCSKCEFKISTKAALMLLKLIHLFARQILLIKQLEIE